MEIYTAVVFLECACHIFCADSYLHNHRIEPTVTRIQWILKGFLNLIAAASNA